MNAGDARDLIDELAPRPSAKAWRWLQDALLELPGDALGEAVAHADAALVSWPDGLREGPDWYRRYANSLPMWKLVRALTSRNGFLAPPEEAQGAPPTTITRLHLENVGADAVEQVEKWPGIADVRSLRVTSWAGYSPGLAGRLIGALRPAIVEELHFEKQGPAADDVVSALTAQPWPALRALGFTSCRDDHVDGLLGASFAGRLESLHLSQATLSAEAAAKLVAGLGGSRLEALSFVRLLDPSLAAAVGASCGSLKSLRAPFATRSLAAFCLGAETRSLESLSLEYHSGTNAADCAVLAAWAGAASLRSFELVRGEGFDDAAFAALAGSAHLDGLRTLHLRECQLGDEGAEAWAARSNPGLRELVLATDRRLGDSGVLALTSSPGLSELRTLSLEEAAIGDESAKAIAASPQLRGLRELSLSRTHVSIQGLRALLKSDLAKGLEGLHLSYPSDKKERIGNAGAKLIAEAPSLLGLRRLSLAGQNMKQHVVVGAFGSSPHLVGLEELDLRDNPDFRDGMAAARLLRSAGLAKLREVQAAEEVI